jgi:hypothetical protein
LASRGPLDGIAPRVAAHRLTLRMGTMLTVAVGVVAALVKLL